MANRVHVQLYLTRLLIFLWNYTITIRFWYLNLVCLYNCINKSSSCYNKLHLNWAIYVDRLIDYGSFVTRNKEEDRYSSWLTIYLNIYVTFCICSTPYWLAGLTSRLHSVPNFTFIVSQLIRKSYILYTGTQNLFSFSAVKL